MIEDSLDGKKTNASQDTLNSSIDFFIEEESMHNLASEFWEHFDFIDMIRENKNKDTIDT